MNKLVSIWSSGGVIIFEEKVAICHRKKENLFCLPKGTPEDDENIEQTAIREVTEETGIIPKIINKIGEVQYTIKKETSTTKYKKDVEYNKIVYYYLMEKIGGDLEYHDHEFDSVLWMSLNEAKEKLTYQNELSIVEKAFHAKN
tara:strand:- start:3024 stop:3455 length:432 start_codon:yes stop_codon:yes gene_type:complete